jgi:hypothetical protein
MIREQDVGLGPVVNFDCKLEIGPRTNLPLMSNRCTHRDRANLAIRAGARYSHGRDERESEGNENKTRQNENGYWYSHGQTRIVI